MSVRYHNVYDPPLNWLGYPEANPDGQDGARLSEEFVCPGFVRREQRINGNWLRPCVGMRADQTSHEWNARYLPGRSFGPTEMHLERKR